jgi:hypothetical protein
MQSIFGPVARREKLRERENAERRDGERNAEHFGPAARRGKLPEQENAGRRNGEPRTECGAFWPGGAAREETAVAAGGATQAPGARTLIRDCGDWQCNPARPGVCSYRLEANLDMADCALWSGKIELGSGEASWIATHDLIRLRTKNCVFVKDLRRLPAGPGKAVAGLP